MGLFVKIKPIFIENTPRQVNIFPDPGLSHEIGAFY